jgi:hypothetical protein
MNGGIIRWEAYVEINKMNGIVERGVRIKVGSEYPSGMRGLVHVYGTRSRPGELWRLSTA